ncbi:hypothetical protein BC567DRAFT_227948 [Phyllosticta citribraziliensis]
MVVAFCSFVVVLLSLNGDMYALNGISLDQGLVMNCGGQIASSFYTGSRFLGRFAHIRRSARAAFIMVCYL